MTTKPDAGWSLFIPSEESAEWEDIFPACSSEEACGEESDLGSKSRVVYIDEAHTADDMDTYISPNLTSNSALRITGYIGERLESKRPHPQWGKTIDKWLKKGCRVEYLFATTEEERISPKVRDSIRRLKNSCPDGHFCAFCLDKAKVEQMPEMDRLFIERMRTFHFTIGSDKPQMWLENNHPEGSPKAFDCEYYPPEEAEEHPLYLSYISWFDHFRDNVSLVLS